MGVKVEIKVNRFPQGGALVKQAVAAAFSAESAPLLSDMQQRTPVDTGELRGSETVASTDTTLTITATAQHAIYVHQGTSRMGARPFMAQAVNDAIPRITETLRSQIESALG